MDHETDSEESPDEVPGSDAVNASINFTSLNQPSLNLVLHRQQEIVQFAGLNGGEFHRSHGDSPFCSDFWLTHFFKKC